MYANDDTHVFEHFEHFPPLDCFFLPHFGLRFVVIELPVVFLSFSYLSLGNLSI